MGSEFTSIVSLGDTVVRCFAFPSPVDIFVSLHAHNVLQLSDFVSYLNSHSIQCSMNQLLHIMNPFLHNSDCASWEEFEKFVRSIQRSDEAFIIPAFPSTFGVSTHINMCKHDDEDE